jgi:Xaa-Pro aminopeptidase
VILRGAAFVFVDGRYTLQVRDQVDTALFEVRSLTDEGVHGWLAAQAQPGLRLGYDPKLVAADTLQRWKDAAARSGAVLVQTQGSLIDTVWNDRPAAPDAPVVPHPLAYAGEDSASKRERLAAGLRRDGAQAALITSPASVAWLFNIRGGDVERTPLPLSTAILNDDGTATLFLAPSKVTDALRSWLGNGVSLRPEDELEAGLAGLEGKAVSVDPASAGSWFAQRLEAAGATVLRRPDPVMLPRACKNAVEIEGARQAHRRDGLAVSRFLAWLEHEAVRRRVDEVEASSRLEAFRHDTGELRDLSFDSIAGAGPNGAIVHYRPSTQTSRALEPGSLFLIDSGGQYPDGTTDVTRTVAIGTPTAEMRAAFTRVLQGHVALSRVRFPPGVTGHALDALARVALWEAGLDYDHGTGHGVGSYLGVHEGPQRIARVANAQALEPGMIVSNEPGYYRTGAWGIRIENLQVVTPPAPIAGGEREMLGFETLTLVPIDRRLIEVSMLTAAERAWVDAYHARVLETLAPQADHDTRAWLEAACAPI